MLHLMFYEKKWNSCFFFFLKGVLSVLSALATLATDTGLWKVLENEEIQEAMSDKKWWKEAGDRTKGTSNGINHAASL